MNKPKPIADPKGAIIFFSTLPVCFPYYALLTIGSFAEMFSRKIKSEEELTKLVNEEADKLGLSKRGLIATFTPYSEARASVFGMDMRDREHPKIVPPEQVNNKDILQMSEVEIGGIYATRAHVRHEVYHLSRGHCNSSKTYLGKLKHIFSHEPSAIIYSLTGLKLGRKKK